MKAPVRAWAIEFSPGLPYPGAMHGKTFSPPALAAVLAAVLLAGCSTSDALRAARVAASGNPAQAAVGALAGKAAGYALNPQAVVWDVKRVGRAFDSLRKAASGVWGQDQAREPSPREYVKYTQNYKSRAVVDFDQGRITVETLDQETPTASLESALVTTLLTPDDPRAVDLFSDREVKIAGRPFLFGEVLDVSGRAIDGPDAAEAFARELTASRLRTRPAGDGRLVRFVVLDMVRDHLNVRAAKYRPLVEEWAGRMGVSRNLVYAVIQTESGFNPFAVSTAGALGLMQVVPDSAGREAAALLGQPVPPPRDALMDPAGNIAHGTAYLRILQEKYFGEVGDPVSREYCMIAAYNGGPGAALRVFDPDKARALRRIGAWPPQEVYRTLAARMPQEESRRYLVKVVEAKRLFVGL